MPVDFGRRNDTPSHESVRGFEDGGVKISRPLLEYSKNALIEVCQSRNVPWVEDPSNHNVQLTLRNAVRHTFQDDIVPKALGQASVLQLASKVEQNFRRYKDQAAELFAKCNMKFDPAVGSLYIRLPSSLEELQKIIKVDNPLLLVALLLQMILRVVTPDEHVDMNKARKLAERIFFPRDQNSEIAYLEGSSEEKHSMCHVIVQRMSPQTWTKMGHLNDGLGRLKPSSASDLAEIFENQPVYSHWAIYRSRPEGRKIAKPEDWNLKQRIQPGSSTCNNPYLYDNRFWIGVENPSPYPLEIRPMEQRDWLAMIEACKRTSLNLLFSGTGSGNLLLTSEEDVRMKRKTTETAIISALNHHLIQRAQSMSIRSVNYLTPFGLKKRGILGMDLTSLYDTVVPVIAVPWDVQNCDLAPGTVLAFPTLGIRVLGNMLAPQRPRRDGGIPWRYWIGKLRWTARYKQVDWGPRSSKSIKKMLISGNSKQRWKEHDLISLDF
jgi:PP-loop family